MYVLSTSEIDEVSGGLLPTFWSGLLETGTTAMGAYEGGVIGAEFGAAGGPIGIVVGGMIGFTAGYIASRTFVGEEAR